MPLGPRVLGAEKSMRFFGATLLLIPGTMAAPKCHDRPLVGNQIIKECDAHLTNGAHCRFSCPSQHSLMGPPMTQCLCNSSGECGWTHGDFVPQCVAWQESWFETEKEVGSKGGAQGKNEGGGGKPRKVSHDDLDFESNAEKTVFTDTQAFNVNPEQAGQFRVLVGDDDINDQFEAEMEADKTFSVEAALDVCEALPDAGNGGSWSCSDTNSADSQCTLSCPDGFTPGDVNGVTQDCRCSSEYDGPIVIDLGCAWEGSAAPTGCVPDSSFEETCIALTAPENGTMSCNDSFKKGSKCTFTCDTETDLIYPAKSSKRRCKCKDNRGCFWTRTDNFCGPPPIEPECSAVPEVQNNYTSIICDDDNNHGSQCEWVCAADFRVNGQGRRSRCKCKRKQGIYSCNWSRDYADRWCVPAPRYYRKWHRKYNKAVRTNDETWKAELEADYAAVTEWADAELSSVIEKLRRRKRSSVLDKAAEFASKL